MLKVPFDIVTSGKEADNEKTFLMGSQKGQETEKHWCSKFQKSYIWVWTLLLAVIFLLILYVLNPYRDSDSFPVNLLNTGDRIQLKSVHSGHYIRVSDATGSLVLDQTIPWKRGSTFEVEAAGECFLLRSLTGKFIRVDNEGIIRSASAQRYGATHFAAITKYENTPIAEVSDRSEDQPLAQVHLKVCKKNLWLQEISQMSANIPPAENNSKENQKKDGKSKSPVFSGTTSRDAEELKLKEMVSDVDSENENENVENESATPLQRLPVRLTNIIVTAPVDTTAMSFGKPTISTGINYRSAVIELKRRFRRLTDFNSNNEDNNENSENNQSNVGPGSIGMKSARPLLTAFEVLPVPQIRGVNLGGWFIPEVWMGQDFFNGTGLGWGGSLCTLVNYSRSLAEERMAHKLATWITEEDLMQIKDMGFNSVRLPIGYWNLIPDPYAKYAPADHKVSLSYIDWCFDTCAKVGLTVLLDLHGAPGSQNGIDHSGCSMDPAWIQPDNVAMTLQAIEAMAKRYSGRKNLVGFELLNEPAEKYGVNNHAILNDFYVKSYKIIRKYSDTALVVFNELYAKQYASWNKEMREPLYFNVVVDWHLYQFQFPQYRTYEHIAAARQWEQTIEEFDSIHPIIVGEWSMGTGPIRQAGQPYVDAAVKSFERSSGWYIWNWKVQPGIGFQEWDVQAQNLKSGGLDPLKFVRELEEENLNYLVKDARGRDKRNKVGDGPADLADN